MSKLSNNLINFRVIALAYLLLGCFFVSKAQDEIRLSPLSSQQFEHCEGDRFYVYFYDAITVCWDAQVFSVLQHNNPVKGINTSVFYEKMVYDEPTMVEDKKKGMNIAYNGDHFEVDGKRLWWSDGLIHDFRNESSLIFETKTSNAKGRYKYTRDEHNRVKRVDLGDTGSNTRIIDYTYWSNTDYIYTIKCYNHKGKLIAETKYDYLTASKKTVLKEVICKIYDNNPARTYAKETYIYRLNYNAALDVNQVDLFFEENGDFKNKEDQSIKVDIMRDKKGNIQTCTCTLIKYIKDNIDKTNSYNRIVNWQFTYDNNNNWTSMTKTQDWNGNKSKYLIKRELVYDTPKAGTSAVKTTTNARASSSSSSQSVSTSQVVVIDGSQLRLRLGPSTSSDTFKWPDGTNRHPNVGDKFRYLGESGDFYKIDFNGNELWVSKQFSHLE